LGGVTLGTGGYIAYAGGHVRHKEFRFEPPPQARAEEHHHGGMEGMQHEGIKMESGEQKEHTGEMEGHEGMQHGAVAQPEKKAVADEMKKTSDEMKKTSDAMKQKSDEMKAGATIYTCPMHPQIKSDKPGKCPICGMTLKKKEGGQ
jgi:rubrerythrin